MRPLVALAALSGFLAVAFGAFAAHGVADARAAEWLRTGAHYQSIHALAVFAALALHRAGARGMRLAAGLFLGGTLLFAGSLYAMAFGAPRALGMVTPIGGLAFMAGWLILAWRAFTLPPTQA
jgi:uncharacterized membrane protein YgdD (TMEM256/DUF423 family)